MRARVRAQGTESHTKRAADPANKRTSTTHTHLQTKKKARSIWHVGSARDAVCSRGRRDSYTRCAVPYARGLFAAACGACACACACACVRATLTGRRTRLRGRSGSRSRASAPHKQRPPAPRYDTRHHTSRTLAQPRAAPPPRMKSVFALHALRAPRVHAVREAMRQPDDSEWRRRSLEKYEANGPCFRMGLPSRRAFALHGPVAGQVAGLGPDWACVPQYR